MSRRRAARTFPIDAGILTLRRDSDAAAAWLVEVHGTRQSFVDLEDPTRLVFGYIRRIGHVVDCFAPACVPVNAVHLGGG
ncbi:MAG: hypothetical protein KY463_15925, partial [Actinobacteria bacterium]|nr:hypothetical protein [Actinomycetota bacterium]